ncbi:hypothetical protein G5I_12212 [Acromyrmex echinatior]|uniref:Uncharacterized protein n=1 Tax=Acromyrmex echinatior TaxID=103372 RepID=F4X1P4_ACREC|nr:hypothetical protein G5I_12212 [Acromyrmex echinatior]
MQVGSEIRPPNEVRVAVYTVLPARLPQQSLQPNSRGAQQQPDSSGGTAHQQQLISRATETPQLDNKGAAQQ